jgi:hypothetical protein
MSVRKYCQKLSKTHFLSKLCNGETVAQKVWLHLRFSKELPKVAIAQWAKIRLNLVTLFLKVFLYGHPVFNRRKIFQTIRSRSERKMVSSWSDENRGRL